MSELDTLRESNQRLLKSNQALDAELNIKAKQIVQLTQENQRLKAELEQCRKQSR